MRVCVEKIKRKERGRIPPAHKAPHVALTRSFGGLILVAEEFKTTKRNPAS